MINIFVIVKVDTQSNIIGEKYYIITICYYFKRYKNLSVVEHGDRILEVT